MTVDELITLENLVEIDGTNYEGGGQILRTSLGLSVLTKKPFLIKNIRNGRPNPGLKKQHISCINACQEISNAIVKGNSIGSEEIIFVPKAIKNRNIEIDIKSAGSVTLLMQSVLIPFLFTNSEIKITGGTDVKWSMPIDYFKDVLRPILLQFCDLEVNFEKRGFFPKGNGIATMKSKCKTKINDFDNFARFHDFIFNKNVINFSNNCELMHIKAICFASKSLQNKNVAEKIGKTADLILKQKCSTNVVYNYSETDSEGSGIVCYAIYNPINENDIGYRIGSDYLSEKETKFEDVGRICAERLSKMIDDKIIVDEHMQDNLIPILGLFGGKFKTGTITSHTKSNIMVCEKFLDVKYKIKEFVDKDNNNIISNIISVEKI